MKSRQSSIKQNRFEEPEEVIEKGELREVLGQALELLTEKKREKGYTFCIIMKI